MRILAVDVGTGTQDILLFDSQEEIENSPQLIMPSPTVVVARQIREATGRGQDVLLKGFTMGGGPCMWAAEDHLRQGYRLFATIDAARTFDDDPGKLRQMGVSIVSDDEAAALQNVCAIRTADLNVPLILQSLRSFGADTHLDGVAVAVFDHGAAPPEVSDRVFRFQYLADTVERGAGLDGFAYLAQDIPPSLTRLANVAASLQEDLPLLVMDTGPAAVLGALEDPRVAEPDSVLVANVGNFHALAFHLVESRITGIFEHHSGELDKGKLERYLNLLASGELTNQEVFDDMGHGALVRHKDPPKPELLAVTGPRRALLKGSALNPYLAVPHGDMMLTGCFGLLRAWASKDPAMAEAVEKALGPPPRRQKVKGKSQ